MIKILLKNKKCVCLILAAVIAFNFLFSPSVSLAQTATGLEEVQHTGQATLPNPVSWLVKQFIGISADALLFVSSLISYLIGTLFSTILYLEAQIIDYIINPANFPLVGARIVQVGWGITRDLANMFFILILLIIAFATVLRIKSWAIQQLWWKVVVAALLINFSLVIAGFVIDFTNILTRFFLNQFLAGGNFWTFTGKIASNMQILNFFNPARADTVLGGAAQFTVAGIAAFGGIALTLIGLVVTVFVFGAAMIFLIVRIIHIWLLLIFAPIIWMLWILPETSSYFSRWWNSFLQWAFFAPIFVFMIYLSDQIFTGTGQLNSQFLGLSLPASWSTPVSGGPTTAAMPAAIFQWILVIAMTFGSLIVAQKFGVEGANASRKMLEGWGNSAKGFATRELRKRGAGWTQPLPEGAPPPTGFKGLIRRAGAGLGQVAVALPGARGAYLDMQSKNKKDYEDSLKKYQDVDPAVLEQMSQSRLIESVDKLAIKQLLISKGKLKPQARELMTMLDQARKYGKEGDLLKLVSEKMSKDLTDVNGYVGPARTELLQRAKRYGNEKDFLKFFPNLAPTIGKTVQEAIKGIEKASDIYVDQMTADVVKEMNPSQLKDIAKNGNNNQRRAAKIAVGLNFNRLSVNEMQGVNDVLFERNNQKREELRKALPEDLRKMSYMKEITTAPAWEYNI